MWEEQVNAMQVDGEEKCACMYASLSERCRNFHYFRSSVQSGLATNCSTFFVIPGRVEFGCN